MRKFAAVALMVTSVVVPVVNFAAPKVAAATVPAGFTDVQVATPGASTGIVGLPDGTVMVLVQSGSVRSDPRRRVAADAGADHEPGSVQRRRARVAGRCPRSRLQGQRVRLPVLHPSRRRPRAAASTAPAGSRCRATRSIRTAKSSWSTTSRRTPATTTAAIWRSAATGSCTSPSATPVPILVADPGPTTPPRISACSTARSCASCRRRASRPPATPSAVPARRAAESAATCPRRRPRVAKSCTPGVCATRSASPSIPTPVRDRFFINDVGSEHPRRGRRGWDRAQLRLADPRGLLPARPEPAVRGRRSRRSPTRSPTTRAPLGQVITASAFIPNGHWPAEYDGGYLFADAGSGNMWLRKRRRDRSTTPPRSPRRSSVASPTWPSSRRATASPCTTRSPVARFARSRRPSTAFVAPGLAGVRRRAAGQPSARHPAAERRRQAGARRRHAVRADGCRPGRDQGGAGQLRVRRAEHARLPHAWAGRSRASVGVEPQRRRRRGRRQLGRRAGRRQRWHLAVRVLHRACGHRRARLLQRRARRGQRRPIRRRRRRPASATPATRCRRRTSTRAVSAPQLPFVRVPVAGRGGLPAVGSMDAAVLVVTAVTNAGQRRWVLECQPGRCAVLGFVEPQHQRRRRHPRQPGRRARRRRRHGRPPPALGARRRRSMSPATSRRRPRQPPRPAAST